MYRFFLKAIVVVGVLTASISMIMIFLGRDQRTPSGEVNETERPSGATDAQENAEAKTPAATERHAGEWIKGTYVFPTGSFLLPCTMVIKAGGSFWFSIPNDNTRYYSEDIESAKEAASAACDRWYSNEMAGRRAVQRANEELAKHRPVFADTGKPLFTRNDTLICPSWEALQYAVNARREGWTRSNYLLGVVDPSANTSGPQVHVGEPVSAEYYGCTISKDGLPVQILENSWTGVGPKTSLGWLITEDLRN